jgi:ubiquitin carboxyl-terminal hydrolase 48
MVNLYNLLLVTEDTPYEFITSDWLVKWLNNEVRPVDNSAVVCPHGKLNPDFLPQTKCISSVAVSDLEVYKFQ